VRYCALSLGKWTVLPAVSCEAGESLPTSIVVGKHFRCSSLVSSLQFDAGIRSTVWRGARTRSVNV